MEENNMVGKRENSFANNMIGWIVTILFVVAVVIFLVSMWKGDESATAFPEGCEPGYAFNITTGVPCPQE